MVEYVYLVPILPLIASIVILFGGKESPKSKMPYLGIATMVGCFVYSSILFVMAVTHKLALPYYATMPWFRFGEFEMTLGVLIDGPAVVMLPMVTMVSSLVQIYSLGYMHGDPRYKRYFAFLSFFTSAMLGLIVASNLMIAFLSWELVGVASYLLIGFWFEKPGPPYASKKAFITTKLADCGFFVGLMLLFSSAGTFDLNMLAYHVKEGYLSMEVATAVGLCFLMGAAGKSAQVPLFIWLPDAMEGPTPVSALIHAATMVAAGVYLVARTYFVFAAGGAIALEVVAWAGLATAFLAGTMALTPYDIKRVLAFSTVSQLGYMMMGLGAGGYTSGMFHLITHAFFKACLFLGAGSVIHAVHTNDMREMGGLSKKMPSTFLTMFIATLAIAGFPFLSGWWSKEAILHDVYVHNPGMWFLAWIAAGLTCFYMFRLIFMTFLGKSRDHHKWDVAHESPASMTIPLWILAVFSIGAGFILHHNGLFAHLVHFEMPGGHGEAHHAPGWLGWAAAGIFAVSAYLAYYFYGGEDFKPAKAMRERFSLVAELLERRYFFDDFFLWWVALFDRIAAVLYWIDSRIVDAIFVDGWGLLTRAFAEINRFFDDFFVDGAVDGVGVVTEDAGWVVRKLVRGRVQEYMLYVALAVGIFAIILQTR